MEDGLKEWETPELIVEDVHKATRGGGPDEANNPGEVGDGSDPEYYSS